MLRRGALSLVVSVIGCSEREKSREGHVEGTQRHVLIHRYVVSGRVQGVGFRWSAQRKANALGLAGWVSNQEDGTVLTEAAGDEATLAEFERWLRRGPAMARVDSVEKVQVPGEIDLVKPFTIR